MKLVTKHKKESNEKPIRIGLPSIYGMEYVPADTITRCEAISNYTRIYFENERPVVVCHTLRYFEEKLVNAGFIRIHRGEMINKNYILKYNTDGRLQLTDGSILTISRRRKREVFTAIAC
ncbi:MAG: LytTR family DNA-binding domain-containing protein [Ginsengibacter sp.]